MSSSLYLVEFDKINMEQFKKLQKEIEDETNKDTFQSFLCGESVISRMDEPTLYNLVMEYLDTVKEPVKKMQSAGWDADQIVPIL